MNEPSESRSGFSIERRLGRLVDGELSPEEYRTLLVSLEEEPGGWRQCAMAFLEAQALSQELSQVLHSPDESASARASADTVSRATATWDKAGVLLAMAACFLVAFGLG